MGLVRGRKGWGPFEGRQGRCRLASLSPGSLQGRNDSNEELEGGDAGRKKGNFKEEGANSAKAKKR